MSTLDLDAIHALHTDSPAGVCPSCYRLGDVSDTDDGLVDWPCPTLRAMGIQDVAPQATPCDCCYIDGHTRRCGRTATTTGDVAPFGDLNLAADCKARITGTAVAQ